MSKYVLALDQGTTSSRAIVFGHDGRPLGKDQQEFPQHYPQPGHVEHQPDDIWNSQLATARGALTQAGITADQVAAIGVTNQRETTILWDRHTGQPIAPAIVWQSRITADRCEKLKQAGLEDTVRGKTGLVIDAYFSGTKIAHLLDQISGARAAAEKGDVLFGTVDSFLIWRLTGRRRHVTDASNASRTMLYNIHTGDWDDELLRAINVPRAMLPDVGPSSGLLGETDPGLFGRAIPITGCAGDQQAATFGQTCFEPGAAKNTYGTGCFLLMNTGVKPVASTQGLITTIAWKLGDEVTYALEGSIFVAGAAVQWLRDGLGIVSSAGETEALAQSVTDNGGVYFVPAFVGLGAPYWDSQARGLLIGLTRGTSRAHLARAALESMAYQTRDVLEAMEADAGTPLNDLRVDGGATANSWLLQFQADQLQVSVQRPVVQETTALGAAYLAGLAVGYWSSLDDLRRNWARDAVFQPVADAATRERLYQGWKRAVERSQHWES